MAHFEKTISEETVYSCRVFTVKKRSVFLENGNYANRDLVIHNGGACILPMDSDGNVYFVRQYRPPSTGKFWNCLPANWKKTKSL